VETVWADYPRERRGAREIARECFSSEVVLGDMLSALGVSTSGGKAQSTALADDLRLTPVSRRPLQLADGSVDRIWRAPLIFGGSPAPAAAASVVVVSHDNLALTRLCLESAIQNTEAPPFELIVVDNGSQDGSRSYLRTMSRRFPQVRLVLNEENRGFPSACNQGLQLAGGRLLLLLNNDTIVPPGWLARLSAHADDPEVGLVGAVTNRIGNEAEVEASYETYGGFLWAASERARNKACESFDIPMPAMFCLAFRRDVYERLGPLDEDFGVGTLEDDDYAERARQAGYRSICADDVLVHHFGEGSFGRLFSNGDYGTLIQSNRSRFERKWGRPWQPYGRRQMADYELVRSSVQETVAERLPAHAAVVVASRGDDELLSFADQEGWHFPQTPEGVYAGHYPANSDDAIEQLEALRERGADYFLLPKTSFWWLEHYRGLGEHLAERYPEILRDKACVVFALNGES
jgi:GT2 family glycosyltransferase